MSFNFFRTAPVIKSDTVLKLERIGKTRLLLQAIDAERKNLFSNTGSSVNGEVTVRRVGSYDSKISR